MKAFLAVCAGALLGLLALRLDRVEAAQGDIPNNYNHTTSQAPQDVYFCNGDLQVKPCPAFDIDIAPKEWDTPYDNSILSHIQNAPVPLTEHHMSCEDKSRFLLMSEDGKWHCLRLVP